MAGNGWRTLVVEDSRKLQLQDGNIILEDDRQQSIRIPLAQLRDLMISPSCQITVSLLNALAEENINVLFTDKKHQPHAYVQGINLPAITAGCLQDQTVWKEDRKKEIWSGIVTSKIQNQKDSLSRLGLPVMDLFDAYIKDIQPGDKTNREGQAARIYFNTLFGKDFVRHASGNVNAALNYGYTIICTAMNRILTLHGYNAAIGIHHCKRTNPVNLACDLMEPFRPFVDQTVFKNKGRELDWDYRKELISVQQGECRYNGRSMEICTAMEQYALDVLSAMKNDQKKPGVIALG